MSLILRKPSDNEFNELCTLIHDYELDNRELQKDQFRIALRDNKLVGFGRLREHFDFFELCSLGVVTAHRRQGIGKAIVADLIKKSKKNIYLVCIIPDFFTPFHFEVVKKFPAPILNKINYCTKELVVPETYVAMLLEK